MDYTTASTISAKKESNSYLILAFLAIFLIIWGWTALDTPDLNNWFLENTLTFLFGSLLIFTHKKYRLSDLSYTFILIYLLLHIYGAKYTYAENPFGFWLQDAFNTSRNHYDRIVHFSFGFMLAYPMRDLFLNTFKFPPKYSWTLPAEITLSFSACMNWWNGLSRMCSFQSREQHTWEAREMFGMLRKIWGWRLQVLY